MNVDRVVLEGVGTNEEYKTWKSMEGQTVSMSPIGPIPNPVRLTDVIARGPESEPTVAFELRFQK